MMNYLWPLMIEQPFPKCVRFIIFARLKIIMFFIILVKLKYSEKATKFESIFHFCFDVTK